MDFLGWAQGVGELKFRTRIHNLQCVHKLKKGDQTRKCKVDVRVKFGACAEDTNLTPEAFYIAEYKCLRTW